MTCVTIPTQGEGKNEVWTVVFFRTLIFFLLRERRGIFFPSRKGCIFSLYCRVQLPGSVMTGIWIVQCFGVALAWLFAQPAVLLLCWCAWKASRAVSVVVPMTQNWKQPLLAMTVGFFCHFCYWFHDCSSREGAWFFATGLAGIHGPTW